MEPRDVQDPAWLAIERACLGRIRAGDRAAFAEIYRAFSRRLYAIVLPLVGDPAAAEDALAATFVAAIERIGQYQDRGQSVFFWLATIARSKAMDGHRACARAGRAASRYEGLLAPLREGGVGPETRLGGDLDPSRLAEAVRRVLAEIPPRQRRAIELRLLEERSRAECAAAIGVTMGAFDVLLLRGLRSFRASWRKIIGEAGET